MGKSKQAKEKKFDRNVEISAPILDPEIIKRIHTPPKGQRLDIKHGGFKALLSDLNSQDSTDELTPLNDNHVPSYIGISCAVSGYSSYSTYSKPRPDSTASSHHITAKTITNVAAIPNRSQTTSPIMHKVEHPVHHITIDKNTVHSVDEERKELTEKLTASATEHMRSPSPCIPPTEDDRHHGAYVGARYCPLPPPSKLVHKHIPLLGIDDDQDPDQYVEEENKVEQKIASLYGDNFVEDWRESMTHKAKKELTDSEQQQQQQHQAEHLKSPKDLVTLKPTPVAAPSNHTASNELEVEPERVELPKQNVRGSTPIEHVEPLVVNETSPSPQVVPSPSPPPPQSPSPFEEHEPEQQQFHHHESPPMSPDSGKNQSVAEEDLIIQSQIAGEGEEHIEYEIRSQSPLDNEASPVKIPHHQVVEEDDEQQQLEQRSQDDNEQVKLVSFSPEPILQTDQLTEEHDQQPKALIEVDEEEEKEEVTTTEKIASSPAPSGDSNDGRYYLNLLNQERSFIMEQVEQAESLLDTQEASLDEDTVGRIRSAIGKANLLINKKFNQFKELCESNINKDSNEQFATLNDDLAGFWDMLSIQVSDVRKLFGTLWQAQENNWNFNNDSQQQDDSCAKQQSAVNNKPVKLSAQKDQERRERLQEHMKQMKQNQAAKSSSENLLDIASDGLESPVENLEAAIGQVADDAAASVSQVTNDLNEMSVTE